MQKTSGNKELRSSMTHLRTTPTLVSQTSGPIAADIRCMAMIENCASVTSMRPKRIVPDT